MIASNIKHTKWDSEWQSLTKTYGKELGEVKKKQVETLLEEGNTLQTEKVELSKEIRLLKDEQKKLNSVFVYYQQAQKELKRLNDNQATHSPQEKNFLGTGVGTKWQTDGWLKYAENHFTPSTGKLDNLYKVKTANGEVETTEEQVINTIARVVRALQKVDADDFEAKYNAKETDAGKQAQVKTYLQEIKDQAQEIVIGSSRDSKQPTYEFSHNYHKGKFADDGTWQPNSTDYSQSAFDYQHFFDFITLTHNQDFLNDLDKDKQKDIVQDANWQINLKGEAWEVDKLKDYGIKIDSSKTTLYKTSDLKTTFLISEGIKDWLDLAHSITQNTNNQTKLISAFNKSPTQQLLSDLDTWTLVDGFTTDTTNFTLPESVESMEAVLSELESDKLVSATKKATIADEISKKTTELEQKEKNLTEKDAEIEGLIKEIVAKQREKLKAYKISDGFADQHKRTVSELYKIEELLSTIRYFENDGDSNQPSSESSENTAYQQITDIQKQVLFNRNAYLIRYFKNLAYKGVNEAPSSSQAIERIKAGKYTDSKGNEQIIYESLAKYYEHFENKEKLVKLDELEIKYKEAIKKAMEKSDEPEKLPEWQSKLKALDPLITETIFTEDKMKDFQKHNNFKNIHGVESLIKKTMDNDKKVKADFIEILKKEDAEVDDLAKMITKISAEKIIKLVHLFDYEKNDKEEVQKEKRRKYSWDRERKVDDKLVGESEDYTISDSDKEDFNKFLYQLATGQKSLSNITKPTEQDENPSNEMSGWKEWLGFGSITKSLLAYTGIVLAIGGICAVIWWDKIKNWWDDNNLEKAESED